MKELKYKIMLKIIRKLRAFINGELQNFINIVYLWKNYDYGNYRKTTIGY